MLRRIPHPYCCVRHGSATASESIIGRTADIDSRPAAQRCFRGLRGLGVNVECERQLYRNAVTRSCSWRAAGDGQKPSIGTQSAGPICGAKPHGQKRKFNYVRSLALNPSNIAADTRPAPAAPSTHALCLLRSFFAIQLAPLPYEARKHPSITM